MVGDRLPLPKCVYINTDLPGNDLNCDNKDVNRNNDDDIKCRGGVNAGSARSVDIQRFIGGWGGGVVRAIWSLL